MKFQVIFLFYAISLVSWSVIAAPIPTNLDQLTLIKAELDASPPLFPSLIKLFFTLKNFYKRFDLVLLDSDSDSEEPLNFPGLYSIMSKYYAIVLSFYNNSPLESLRAVRLYGNFEFACLFTEYILNDGDSISFSDLKYPFCTILKYKEMKKKFKTHKFNILNNYERIRMRILLEPFKASPQTQTNNTEDSKVTIQNDSYNAFLDWEERMKILEETTLSIKSLNIFARHLSVDVSWFLIKIKRKVDKHEFVVKNFQVDSRGPSLGHFVSIFYQLQSLVQDFKFYKDLPLSTKKLFSLFSIYRYHFIEEQLTNPLLFPKKMLAIVSHENCSKENIFTLLKLPINVVLKKVAKSMRRCQIYDIVQDDLGELILEIYEINVKNQAPYDNFDLGKGLWHNLLNLQNTLSARKRRIVKSYLALQSNN
jgi:hypothetical protein